jgi:Holliday junction resolvase-like predicted endonuclease
VGALPKRKQRRVARAALAYLRARKLEDREIRFDFVAVDVAGEGRFGIQLMKNAFWPGELGRGTW